MQHVSIIVPYRNRASHLTEFIPHMLRFLEVRRTAGLFDYSIHVIEQLGSESFNRGKLLNCGVAIAAPGTDFACLHDVDYLPVDADYGPVDRPTRLIWNGLTLQEDYEMFFGAVVTFPISSFVKVNGYSNGYWGWGYEDIELRLRCQLSGIPIGRRDGTYRALPHAHNGLLAPGQPTAAAVENRNRLRRRLGSLQATYRREGLNSLRFDLRESLPLGTPALRRKAWLHQVHIGRPMDGVMAAAAAQAAP